MEYYTPSVDLALIHHLSLCVNFQSFFSFWKARDTPSIEVDRTEQQFFFFNQSTEWLWKIVLLTLAASRGVTDLYPS